jgi:hypothetical protein
MQAIDRIVISHNWITITVVFAMLLLFVLKKVDQTRLIGYSKSFFITGFIEGKVKEKPSFFSFFNLLIFVFTMLVISLSFLLLIQQYLPSYTTDFSFFITLLGFVTIYFLIFLVTDVALSSVFQIKKELHYFIIAKMSYLYTMAIWLFPILILIIYGLKNTTVLAVIIGVLFALRVLLILTNNKSLIVNKLFYFILYLCAFEIAPLLIFYKIII